MGKEEYLMRIDSLKEDRKVKDREFNDLMKKSDTMGHLMIWLGLLLFPILIPIRLSINKKIRNKATEIAEIDYKIESLRKKIRSIDNGV